MRPHITLPATLVLLALALSLCLPAAFAADSEAASESGATVESLQADLEKARAEVKRYREAALKNKEVAMKSRDAALKLKKQAEQYRDAYNKLKAQHDELKNKYRNLNAMMQAEQPVRQPAPAAVQPRNNQPKRGSAAELLQEAGPSPNAAGLLRDHYPSDKTESPYFSVGFVSAPKLVEYGGRGAWLVTFRIERNYRKGHYPYRYYNSARRQTYIDTDKGKGYAFIRDGGIVSSSYALGDNSLRIPSYRDGNTGKYISGHYDGN